MRHDEDYFVLFKPKGRQFYYYYVYRHGKRVWRSTGKATKKEAQRFVLDRVFNGDILTDKPTVEMKFGQFGKDFWNYDTCPIIQDKIKRGGHYSVAEAKHHQARVDSYIMPTFKDRFLADISRSDVNRWLLSLPDKYKISAKTANMTLLVFKQMLNEALCQDLIFHNPCEGVKALVHKEEERGCFTDKQVNALFSEMWDNQMAYTGCLLSLLTGLRIGEVQALRYRNLTYHETLDNKRIWYLHIDSSFNDSEGIKSTKNGKARDIKIVDFIKDMLLSLDTVKGNVSEDTFFFSISGTRPIDRRVLTDRLQKKMKEAGIDYVKEHLSFHSLRHYANSQYLPIIGGEMTRQIIGHTEKDKEMTLHYFHDTEAGFDKISTVQDKMLLLTGNKKK